jgi:hypothetical protein
MLELVVIDSFKIKHNPFVASHTADYLVPKGSDALVCESASFSIQLLPKFFFK